MNKIFKILIPVLLVVLTFTGCGQEQKPCAEHFKGDLVSTTATCTTAGVGTYHCMYCNELMEVEEGPFGHNFRYINNTQKWECTRCHENQYDVNLEGFEEGKVLTYHEVFDEEIRNFSFKLKSFEYLETQDSFIYEITLEALTDIGRQYYRPYICYRIKGKDDNYIKEWGYNGYYVNFFCAGSDGNRQEEIKIGDEVNARLILDLRQDIDIDIDKNDFYSFTFEIVPETYCIFHYRDCYDYNEFNEVQQNN